MRANAGIDRIVATTCVAASLSGLLSAVPVAADSQVIRVVASVMPRVWLTDVRQVVSVVVTTADVERGFVEVVSAARFHLASNTPTHFEARGAAPWFVAVGVRGLPDARHEWRGPETYRAMLPPFRQRIGADLSFRFELATDTGPGVYAWPLALSLTPI